MACSGCLASEKSGCKGIIIHIHHPASRRDDVQALSNQINIIA